MHWHGQIVPPDVDGAEEEKSRVVPSHGHLRYRFTPQPAVSISGLSKARATAQAEPRKLSKGKRYRLVFDNHTDDDYPVHQHLHMDYGFKLLLRKWYLEYSSNARRDFVRIQQEETDLPHLLGA